MTTHGTDKNGLPDASRRQQEQAETAVTAAMAHMLRMGFGPHAGPMGGEHAPGCPWGEHAPNHMQIEGLDANVLHVALRLMVQRTGRYSLPALIAALSPKPVRCWCTGSYTTPGGAP